MVTGPLRRAARPAGRQGDDCPIRPLLLLPLHIGLLLHVSISEGAFFRGEGKLAQAHRKF